MGAGGQLDSTSPKPRVCENLCPEELADGLNPLGIQRLNSILIWDYSFKRFVLFWEFNKLSKTKPCHSIWPL